MKRGGKVIYSGKLRRQSSKLVSYFEGINGVPRIIESCNPATWMLHVTSCSAETQHGLDFANIYKEPDQCRETEELVKALKHPKQCSRELHFPSPFPRNEWVQFRACLWKQNLSYWRSPKYNLVRLLYIFASSVLFGALLWGKGQIIENEGYLFNLLGSMFIFVQFLGVGNCTSILPYIANERTIMYRERFAGMYSSWASSLAQVTIELPYIFLQTFLFVGITYPAIKFYWSIYKVFWYFYTTFLTLLNFTYLGMLLASLIRTYQVAAIFASFCYSRVFSLDTLSLNRDHTKSLTMEFEAIERSSRKVNDDDDEEDVQWAAIERLPTFERLRTSLFDDRSVVKRLVDVTKLGALERQVFIENLFTNIEEDNHRLLLKLKERTTRVGLEFATVEVRYHNLTVDAECEVVYGKPLPTLWNTLQSNLLAIPNIFGGKSKANTINILQDVSGIIKPSRLTLLLGPPGCGKTTLLRALSGKLDQSLKVTGNISYNGYKLDEFVPQKTSAYISQNDLHVSEMTVRETLDFSARCQGIGSRGEIMMEVITKEKEAGLLPEPNIDAFMKAISIEGLKRTLLTDYILKILGLDICADTSVGDAMRRGISGGQKKRLTTGEMIIGPTKALFMDEISNGLDSSTTFQIVSHLQQLTHIMDSTILISLLQPAPETFDLFDDIVFMAEGKILYHGPRINIIEFFHHCGFKCPPRKSTADFLQEVISKKDQVQYWYHTEQPYRYVPTDSFVAAFQEFHVGAKLMDDLSRPFNKSDSDKKALSFDMYSLRNRELFKACMAREWLLMKRNSFTHVFKSAQIIVTALITMTVFIRTRMKIDVIHANFYMGSFYYSLSRLVTNGIAELSLTSSRLSVFYKQRDSYFYPAWAFAVPSAILKIPFSAIDAFLWTSLTYYTIGYSQEPERFFYQFLLFFLLHQVSTSLFRLIASLVRNPSVATSCGLFSLLLMFLFGGFIIKKPSLPSWIQWGFWLSPLTYAEIGITLNEFRAPRWQKDSSSNVTIGQQVLVGRGLDFSQHFYWISLGALVGFWIVINIGFTCALSFLKPPGTSPAIISHERLRKQTLDKELSNVNPLPSLSEAVAVNKGLVMPFKPIVISFENVQYFADTPKRLKEHGIARKKLQLLTDITGAFRPGVLTALMGVSGAGKTTLMDVLSGRKTGGAMEGEIRINGYPKFQDTYARVSGYCEQTDVHSPQITIEESVTYSAWLRLPSEIDPATKRAFIQEVLGMIELDGIKDALVGTPGFSGISTEQRKRLTIAVELVSNPSIIFMDEPTSGLDARSAAIVMRAVQNIVCTNRTVVCTIHQPSIHIFEEFDELILMKRGGKVIYSGELGRQSSKLVSYFEGINGVPRITESCNPATWMLDVTSPSVEAKLGLDFADIYKESDQCRETEELVKALKHPKQGSRELHFPSPFPRNEWVQFKACLWKQNFSYWRSPKYNLVRLLYIFASSVLFGALLWGKGQIIENEADLFNILGSMFIFVQFLGVGNCTSILPYIANERTIMYRERFAGMYSSWAFSLAQVTIELPYIFLQTILFVGITYPAIKFYWSIYKVFWYFYTTFLTLLSFTYLGMLLASLTRTDQVAAIFASFCYTLLSLFSGYLIPEPQIPKWWVWCYWICPNAWSLKALLTSQYGDITKEIEVYGERKPINAFLESYFGFYNSKLGVTALVLLAFPFVYATVFACAIAKLNFQKR